MDDSHASPTHDRYTHGHHESVLRSHRWRTAANSAQFLLPHLRPGLRLLDVGCGPGTITADLAGCVGDGTVVGIDRSPTMIATVRAEYRAANLTFCVGDAYDLQFADDTFDVVYAHQVLQHLSDPVAALRELRRVTRPGGIVAVRDSDYAAFAWAPRDPTLDRWMTLYHDLTRHNRAEADAGRFLKAWALDAGFTDVRASSSTWTFHDPDDRAWWGGTWSERALHSEFATQALQAGLTDPDELHEISAAFLRWAADPRGIFVLVHGEVLAVA